MRSWLTQPNTPTTEGVEIEMRKVECANDHRMIEVVPGLLLCECSSYGPLSDMKGAVEEARALVARAGGIEALRDRVEGQERKRKAEAKEASLDRARQFSSGLKRK